MHCIIRYYLFISALLCFTHNSYAKKIIIDPGHGGIHLGAMSINKVAVEKDIVLAIALELAALLKRTQHTVILTRSHDSHFSVDRQEDIKKRSQFVIEKKPDIYISLHCDSLPNKTVQGFCIYIPRISNYAQESYRLAGAVHAQCCNVLIYGTEKSHHCLDRGIRAASYYGITHALCPAILIELDCLSHKNGAERLTQKSYQKQLAEAICAGLTSYAV